MDIEDERNRLDFIHLELEIKTSNLENLKKKNILQLYVQMLVENNFAKQILRPKKIQNNIRNLFMTSKRKRRHMKKHIWSLCCSQYEDLKTNFMQLKVYFQPDFLI